MNLSVRPVLKVLYYREYPNALYNRIFLILMTRLPGSLLENSADTLLVEYEDLWLFELSKCVVAMRE